ncbi:amino acid ABC transporter permease [Paenibacillus aurantius]|uniref:Amino acid ABC transporter permease n=1 Tax=Paenibacillus aurantius TaxID=2918900 RepID=A0AA96LKS1_9BACL|nr:amino acid ABC transporter permease [Paenibacillus aurantius]WNQ13880.1 amino acid ABC transporter permease [Paenibacillus aurantius]
MEMDQAAGTSRLWQIVIESFWPMLQAGLKYTLTLTVISFVLGLCLAFLLALARISRYRVLSVPASLFVGLIRGTPLLVQLFIIFYGLPRAGVTLDPFLAAVIGFTLNMGAYNSEILRASILSVPDGQWEAAASIGMNRRQSLRRIILPQAVRVSIPPLSNSFVGLVKDTSLAATITLTEMFQVSQQKVAYYYEPLLLYVEVAVLYLVFCTILYYIQGKLERRFDRLTGA